MEPGWSILEVVCGPKEMYWIYSDSMWHEFRVCKKQRFKLKEIERPIYIWNVDSSFNEKELIEYMVEVNIYY